MSLTGLLWNKHLSHKIDVQEVTNKVIVSQSVAKKEPHLLVLALVLKRIHSVKKKLMKQNPLKSINRKWKTV